MKKIISLILLMCMVLSFAAYADESAAPEITMQEIYEANLTEALLKNHESVYVQDEADGEIWSERYLTKEYAYEHFYDEDFDYAELMMDDARYVYSSGDRLLYLFITPDGVGDFASEREERYASALAADIVDETIEFVSKKDGRITVASVLSSKNLEALAESSVTAGKFEYVLDAKSREMISIISDCTYDDGSALNAITEMTYDAEVPEMLKEFLEYENQTENLRNVTVVSNPGAEKEESKSIQAPKGLIIGFEFDDAFEGKAGFYTDAACTEDYDPFADIDSDLTIYVKWTE